VVNKDKHRSFDFPRSEISYSEIITFIGICESARLIVIHDKNQHGAVAGKILLRFKFAAKSGVLLNQELDLEIHYTIVIHFIFSSILS
jgi:hypothetical protein